MNLGKTIKFAKSFVLDECRLSIKAISYMIPEIYYKLVVAGLFFTENDLQLKKRINNYFFLPFFVDCRFDVEIYNNATQKWDTIRRNNSRHVIIDKLPPLTSHKVRLKVHYPLSQTSYLWLADGFTFETSGQCY